MWGDCNMEDHLGWMPNEKKNNQTTQFVQQQLTCQNITMATKSCFVCLAVFGMDVVKILVNWFQKEHQHKSTCSNKMHLNIKNIQQKVKMCLLLGLKILFVSCSCAPFLKIEDFLHFGTSHQIFTKHAENQQLVFGKITAWKRGRSSLLSFLPKICAARGLVFIECCKDTSGRS